MKKDSGHLTGELTKSRIQKESHLQSAICSPSMSSLCLKQCLAQRCMNAKWCLCASILHATHLGAYMLYGGVAWVHFFLIISRCRARQGPGVVEQGSTGQEGERASLANWEGPSTGGTCAQPLKCGIKKHNSRLRQVSFSLLTRRIVDSRAVLE